MRRILLFILAIPAAQMLGIVAAEITPGEMIRVPAGIFETGNPNDDRECEESPVHEVTPTTAFEIGKYEVANQEYATRAGAQDQTPRRAVAADRGWASIDRTRLL